MQKLLLCTALLISNGLFAAPARNQSVLVKLTEEQKDAAQKVLDYTHAQYIGAMLALNMGCGFLNEAPWYQMPPQPEEYDAQKYPDCANALFYALMHVKKIDAINDDAQKYFETLRDKRNERIRQQEIAARQSAK